MPLTPRFSKGANVTPLPNGWRMEIPAGDASAYRFAQLDDYASLPRRRFPSHPSLTFSLRARVSSDSIAGTWGFGLWNDPFGLSLGFGGNPFRLPALPNAIWFFHASEENWLSFNLSQESESSAFGNDPKNNPEVELRDSKMGLGDSRMELQDSKTGLRDSKVELRDSKVGSGNGFLAQAFSSPNIPSPLLALAGILASPLLATRRTRRWLRGLASRVIGEAGTRISVDQTQWHAYRLEWSPTRSAFWVDDALVFESPVSPRPPLGLVVWIDNQFAKFTPEGEIGFGVLKNEAAWLEVEDLHLKQNGSG